MAATTEPVSEKKDGRRSDLPDRIVEHLTTAGPATPYNIGKAIGRSAGAVTVAGRYLRAEGRLEIHSDKPLAFRIPGDDRQIALKAKSDRVSGEKPPRSKGKGADRIEALNAKKAVAKAAREAGHPVPESQLATMTVEQANKVAEARRTRKAPAAKAS